MYFDMYTSNPNCPTICITCTSFATPAERIRAWRIACHLVKRPDACITPTSGYLHVTATVGKALTVIGIYDPI